MIDQCRRFMRSCQRIQIHCRIGRLDQGFGESPFEVFAQFFAWLCKSDLQKLLETGILQGAFLVNREHSRCDFGWRHEGFGRNLEAQLRHAGIGCEDGERGKIAITASGSKFDGHFFLNHDQNRLAPWIMQCSQDKMGSNIIRKIGYQMIRLIQ